MRAGIDLPPHRNLPPGESGGPAHRKTRLRDPNGDTIASALGSSAMTDRKTRLRDPNGDTVVLARADVEAM